MGTSCSLIWNGLETGFQVERSEKQNRPEKLAEHDTNHQQLKHTYQTRGMDSTFSTDNWFVHRILGHTPFLSYN